MSEPALVAMAHSGLANSEAMFSARDFPFHALCVSMHLLPTAVMTTSSK